MTHKDIYTKFMIEYDKANVTSSYPSLTEYEVATVLDKAYHALIAQKVTGNNVRRVALEGDLKSVTDIAPLIKNKAIEATKISDTNVLKSELPEDYLYFVTANMIWPNVYKEEIEVEDVDTAPHMEEIDGDAKAYDGIKYRKMPIKLVSHDMANNFIATSYNIPWIKIPVCYIEENDIFTVYDSFKSPDIDKKISITYIKTPNKFAKDLSEIEKFISESSIYSDAWNSIGQKLSYFQPTYTVDKSILDESEQNDYEKLLMMDSIEKNFYTFECNDTMAEELISLAVAFALENVESQRLNSKLNMRGLEA